jgi:hypothetical protein
VSSQLHRLKGLIDRGLGATAGMWPAIRMAFAWVHLAAHILGAGGGNAKEVRKRLGGLLGAMARPKDKVGALASAVGHFLKVSRSYWPGLFHCDAVADLPRTNNALEQLFGSYRHHERRVSGRKVASPALVLRGSARILAAVATRQRPERVKDLIGADRENWAKVRSELAERRQRRCERRRFRRDPEGYLRLLEAKLIQPTLPT